MKLTFKTEEKVLTEVDSSILTAEKQDELKRLYNNVPIRKYELVFNDGVLSKECHDIEKIPLESISELIITLHII